MESTPLTSLIKTLYTFTRPTPTIYMSFVCLFVYLFWLCQVFIAAHSLSLVSASRGWLLLSSKLRCEGFSLWWVLCCRAQALGLSVFNHCGEWVLQRFSFSRCGTLAQLLLSMWDLPGPGIEPMSSGIGRQILNHWPTREVPVCLNITRLVRRFLLRRNMSLSKIHCCYIIISTELKEKHTLKKDGEALYSQQKQDLG